MKKTILLLILSIGVPLLMSGQYLIEGKITDSESGAPLTGANIALKNTFKGVVSDARGNYVIENLPKGDYELTVSFIGYQTINKKINLSSDIKLDIALQKSAIMTDEIVVKAIRAGSNTPTTHSNLNHKDLASSNLGQDLPFMLNLTPSLITSSDAGAGIGYTWMNIRGSDNTRINVTLNGVPVNDAESHGVWWVNMPDIASSTDNIQIQRGLGLSTHGSGAFGATVSLQTTTLKDKAYAEISSSAGSYNTLKNSLGFGTGLIDQHWTFDGRISRITSDGYVDRASAKLTSYYLSGAYYGRNTVIKLLTFSGEEKTYQAWTGVPGDSLETNRTMNPSGMYYDDEGNLKYYDNEIDNYHQEHFQVHLTQTVSNILNFNISGHYTFGKGYYEQYKPNEKFSSYNLPNIIIGNETIKRTDLIRRRWLDNDAYGFTYSLNYEPKNRLKLVLGGGYQIYQGEHFGEIIWAKYALNANIRDRYYDNDALKKDFNSFLKVEFEPVTKLHLFADLQYRNIYYDFLGLAWIQNEVAPLQQRVNFNFFNPKAGISYKINTSGALYLYAGIGSREPVRSDFTNSSPDSRPKHEIMKNIETGYRHKGKRMLLNSNIFFMDYKDQLILTGEINDVGKFARQNVKKSWRAGIEIEAAFMLSNSFQWNANLSLSRHIIPKFIEYSDKYDDNWNWTDFDIKEYRNTKIAFSPEIIASSQISYKPFENLIFSLSSKYVGDQYIDNTSSRERMLDAYLIHNLRANYSFNTILLGNAEITLQINNLLDTKYITNGWIYKGVVGSQGLITIEDGYFPQAGIHFLAGINLKF